uniref:Girdin n=1 Tax=Callorhinchus milii TaxID=7868 RepID=V9K8Z0_CALMI
MFRCRQFSEKGFTERLHQFMVSPLVIWIQTLDTADLCDEAKGQYLELEIVGERRTQDDYMRIVDGVFLNLVMRRIDPGGQNQRIYRNEGNDKVLRTQNLTILLQHMKSFYQEDLQQLIVMSLPNIYLLGHDPLTEESLVEANKLLLLLLGCAVQCAAKEEFITEIQQLNLETQSHIAHEIQQITQDEGKVLCIGRDHCLRDPEILIHSLSLLASERDRASQRLWELLQESEPQTRPVSCTSPEGQRRGSGGSRQHLTVQLADSRAKLRRVRQELEEKSEELQDCEQEVRELSLELRRFQNENRELVAEVRRVRLLGDEVDVLREKAIRVERLQNEVKSYKERLSSVEFYKNKLEEERGYSAALLETKVRLEEQLETARTQCDQLHRLEKHNHLLTTHLQDLQMEREVEQQRVEQLLEENLSLRYSIPDPIPDLSAVSLAQELSSGPFPEPCGGQPLSCEVEEAGGGLRRELERENERLRLEVEELRTEREERRRERARQEPELTADTLGAEALFSGQSEVEEKQRLETTEWENLEREVRELKLENAELRESLGERAEAEPGGRGGESGNQGPPVPQVLPESEGRPRETEQELQAQGLREELVRERLEAEGLSSELEELLGRVSRLETDKRQLERDVERLSGLRSRLQGLESERDLLEQERAQLRATLDLQEADILAKAQLEMDKRELESEVGQLRRTLDLQKSSLRRAGDLESTLRGAQEESGRLARELESGRRRVRELEDEAEEGEAEAERLRRSLEEQKVSIGRLELARAGVEAELERGEKDNRRLAKENRRLHQQAELRESALDAHILRVTGLEQDNRQLSLELSRAQADSSLARELDAENVRLSQQLTEDRRTSSSLRDELSSERLTNLALNGDLERLRRELHRQSLRVQSESDRSGSVPVVPVAGDRDLDGRSQTLGQAMSCEPSGEGAESSGAIGEEPPGKPPTERKAAEGRESGEERGKVGEEGREGMSHRLIEVERKNERLLAENEALSGRLRWAEGQSGALQGQVMVLQKHSLTLQEQVVNTQSLNASLQAENGLLRAQGEQWRSAAGGLEAEKKTLGKEREALRARHEALTTDHQRLGILHERQEAELETLVQKYSRLKSSFRAMELDTRDLDTRYKQLLGQKMEVDDRATALKEREEAMAGERQRLRDQEEQLRRLQEEYNRLERGRGECEGELEEVRGEVRGLRYQVSELQRERTRAESESNSHRQHSRSLEIELTKLGSQCELMAQLKANVEEENRHLSQRLQTLSDENHHLMERSLERREREHEEQREHQDKLNELRREKQKLLEKIMDQYRVIDPTMPRRKGNWIADKMKRLIKPRQKDLLRAAFIAGVEGPDPSSDPAPKEPTEGPETPAAEGGDSPGRTRREAEGLTVKVRRKLSSRLQTAETPRHRFRQRRAGGHPESVEGEDCDNPTAPGAERGGSEDPAASNRSSVTSEDQLPYCKVILTLPQEPEKE